MVMILGSIKKTLFGTQDDNDCFVQAATDLDCVGGSIYHRRKE